MYDGGEKRLQMFWSVFTKTEEVRIGKYMLRVFLKLFKAPVAISYD